MTECLGSKMTSSVADRKAKCLAPESMVSEAPNGAPSLTRDLAVNLIMTVFPGTRIWKFYSARGRGGKVEFGQYSPWRGRIRVDCDLVHDRLVPITSPARPPPPLHGP